MCFLKSASERCHQVSQLRKFCSSRAPRGLTLIFSRTRPVPSVEQVSFSGKRATAQGQDVTYVTERCVLRLIDGKVTVTEIAPGIDLNRDILAQAAFPLAVADTIRPMSGHLFMPDRMDGHFRLAVAAE